MDGTMDASSAMQQANQDVTRLISGLTPEHREMPTPCDEWTVHELINHMCEGAHLVAGAFEGQAPPDEVPNFLAEGPMNGWSTARSHLEATSTPDVLTSLQQMPFGEVPGEAALSLIVADHITHAWDLAQASGQDHGLSDELCHFALATWEGIVPAEGRDGKNFDDAIAVGSEASAIDQLCAYTGRQPA